MNDRLGPDIYEQETKLLFKCTRSDPSCLMPKSCNLERWHNRYFKHFKIIPTMNNYLSILGNKMMKLRSAQENIDANLNKIRNDFGDDKTGKNEYSTRHQKITLFQEIENEIILMILTLTQTINGCYILCEDSESLYGVFCELDDNLKSLKKNKNKNKKRAKWCRHNHNVKINGMEIDGMEDEKENKTKHNY